MTFSTPAGEEADWVTAVHTDIKVVMLQHFTPFWCIGIGIGKSLICIRVEFMTSPIVIT